MKKVLGLGSNVVDLYYSVKSWPSLGEKVVTSGSYGGRWMPGGVVLNHLVWMRKALPKVGWEVALLARQGDDRYGQWLRKEIKRGGVSEQWIEVGEALQTAVSMVFVVDGTGERSIVMDRGAMSGVNRELVRERWKDAVCADGVVMVTSEVSQVPLVGVAELLYIARKAGKLTALDFDISPESACEGSESLLGSWDDLLRGILPFTNILKITKHGAQALVRRFAGKKPPPPVSSLLGHYPNLRLLVVTDGAQRTSLYSSLFQIHENPLPILHPIDTTGAGDAFFGTFLGSLLSSSSTTSLDHLTFRV